ncbi:acetate--CoA ligase family protein [Kutzneria sp. CA-103260]|uniref:acetate--CoA ligase family protein n=1 Tax=Kutzneria sp. CA-103260 TaxID=2802641 RepID=UPI001BAA5BA9|nr:acetate--CoA ligase family protein [Kutzneria sp. CA-103260]QUQ65930.1 CoA-binding domain-containing protein [Kutzneria sp. CA-103260]
MHGLGVFRDPASVAVVGASEDRSKWGHWLAAGALTGAGRRRVHLVSRRGGTVCGQPCATNLRSLDEVPELVVLCVPATHVPEVVTEGLSLGVKGFLGITAGVSDELELARRIRSGGARLVGANSLGIVDTATELCLAWGSFTAGPLAIVSQSGQVGSELALLGERHGLGISRFVSLGNAADVTATELLADLADHSATEVVAVYLENFTDGSLLLRALRGLREVGKPTLLLTVGGSAASTRLARSHTGSLTSPLDVVDAACRAAGVARVSTPSELIDVARALLAARPPHGDRVAIIGDSGGQCGIAADVAHTNRLTVPAFSHDIGVALPAGSAAHNPVDLAGAGEQDIANYARITEAVLRRDDVDAAVLTGYFGRYGLDIPAIGGREVAVAQRIGAAVADAGKPVVVHSMGPDSATAHALWAVGVPTYDRIEAALSALRGLVAFGRPPELPLPYQARPLDALPEGYWETRQVLVDVAFPRGLVVRARAELARAARLTAPYVLKAAWLEHKSEAGGVRIGLATVDQLTAAYDEMSARLGPGDYVVEEQDIRPDTVEILIGARRDPDFGPLVVVGAGGTETELRQDIATELAPVSPATARDMLGRLHCAPLLRGWRGRPAVDIGGLADLVHRMSLLVAASPLVGELELNPVRVGPDGPLAVDALIFPVARQEARHA